MRIRSLKIMITGFAFIASSYSVAAKPLPQTQIRESGREVTIPFELINRHIVLKVSVNKSTPLCFVLDTGDKFAIIDIDRARSIGLNFQGKVSLHGAGADLQTGAFVKDAAFTIPGLEGFSQPVTLALPIGTMSSRLGQDFDGIIGSDFIEQFVVKVNYPARTLTLYDKDRFSYSGNGEILPIKLNSAGHPVIDAVVTPLGGKPIRGKFVVDLGSAMALALYSPFVKERTLLNPNLKTIRALGGAGAGGEVKGQLGRVSELKLGSFKISQPITFFSQDESGAFASVSVLGNIGAQIMSQFNVFLDYNRERMIIEPNARFGAPFDRAFPGFSLLAEGSDYRTFRVDQVLENSPATDAKLQPGDVITAVDGKPASQMTLTTINQLFERPAAFTLTVLRKDQTLNITLTTRRMI